ncbi:MULTISPECIES: bifunctional adenosylcobinamide kinase/adenosylcobinamide-phosphate guanylyltransferase [Brevibacillus]|uniref:bifunctional adenosylcobinamide kinase/adenosylcobinamide-phosphate guanylyltransferase n=1 Tax=Brevibacillus TaxID=55080 RepID=UPI000D0E39F5|nr:MULTISPECIES: bifunctional adenosylcobinamide kinase/adenosylcobinamide-phosphate guanylyltransferase [Brevibacillus]MED1948044.1 bifunctional adenosylcobinamide kinase/adenosylcobinamide-phosphate guanylyltransferase [Brevibacillus formosus]MED1998225.1 bifunctional adenosylcobinamide kinase/adenosylcobinamide-phosphate guanylyltransferase [Brevibacillus formosus]MED2080766.1 bifunctional adenosylcobinamide kinase/adenosylcobinamide-phosphate guanylyltransferase [Brevibacillus formosus]PSK2
MSLVLVTGGVRSGKSRYAEELAMKLSSRVLYVATGKAWDDEMKQRIELHQARRPLEWGCVEVGERLTDYHAFREQYDVVLIDCLSTWVSNRLMSVDESEWRSASHTQALLQEAEAWLSLVQNSPQKVIAVTSEVGLGGIALSRLGRWFADVLGDVNQRSARQADAVYAVLSGIPWRIKG